MGLRGLVLVGASCLIGAEIGQLIVVRVEEILLPALWPPLGILTAALILADARRCARVVATGCAAMFVSMVILHGRPVLSTLGLSVVFGLEASVAAWAVRRTTNGPFALDQIPHTWALIAAAAIVPGGGGILATNVLRMDGHAWSLAGWLAWWLAGMLGILVTAPLVLAAVIKRHTYVKILTSWRALELVVVCAGTTMVAWIIFADQAEPLLRIPAYLLPFLLWPVFRFGPGVAATNLFLVSLVGLWNAAHGHGPFAMAGASAAATVLRSQGALAIAAISFLLLASEVAERKRVAQVNARLVAELRHAFGEIKTLRGLIPICAWCHKVRDDAGFWQEIERYVDEHTDATFSHGICPSCAAKASGEIAEYRDNGRVS